MAGQTSPYIKSEPNSEFFDPNQYMQYNQHQGTPNNSGTGSMNINPANLSSGMSQGYMSSSFHMGSSGIADDELLDLDLNQSNQQQNNFDFNTGVQNFLNQQQINNSNQIFSHTPDGAPIQSPFVNEVNYGQFRPIPTQQFSGAHSVPHGPYRPHMAMDRRISDSRSSATPNTPAINTLQVNDEYQQNQGMRPSHHRQQNSMSGGWESTPSGDGWENSSPFPSPANGQPIHPQISEVLKNTQRHKVASSLPTKIEPGTQPPFGNPQEAKRRRRRESHNMVERRRRDNINERIHDLGTLVPQHRLEDEKVRKHLQTNAPLSPSIANATSMSPPNASLLSASRRQTSTGPGNITQGLPLDDKDKGPNKGDILNGSVAWTRDIMWYLHMKFLQEQELRNLVSKLGGVWPFETTEDERRMRFELLEILNKHQAHGGFTGYSRAPGSGMRVPGFTNIAGETIAPDGQSNGHMTIPPATSPGFQSGGSGMSSGGGPMAGGGNVNQQFWSNDFKEEDEYGMDLQ